MRPSCNQAKPSFKNVGLDGEIVTDGCVVSDLQPASANLLVARTSVTLAILLGKSRMRAVLEVICDLSSALSPMADCLPLEPLVVRRICPTKVFALSVGPVLARAILEICRGSLAPAKLVPFRTALRLPPVSATTTRGAVVVPPVAMSATTTLTGAPSATTTLSLMIGPLAVPVRSVPVRSVTSVTVSVRSVRSVDTLLALVGRLGSYILFTSHAAAVAGGVVIPSIAVAPATPSL